MVHVPCIKKTSFEQLPWVLLHCFHDHNNEIKENPLFPFSVVGHVREGHEANLSLEFRRDDYLK